MAANDGKSIENPLLFTSWQELLSYSDNTDDIHYFQYSSSAPLNITINEQISGNAIWYIDWRGAYINSLVLNIPYNNDTKDTGTSGYSAPEMAFAFKNYDTRGMHWRNLEVENFIINDPRVGLVKYGSVYHNCYFNNVVVNSELTATSDYWLTQKGENACPFGMSARFSESQIKYHAKNIAPRVPIVCLWSSELIVDYKWDLTEGSLNNNGIMPRCYPSGTPNVFASYNGILSGTIDISKAVGEETSATGNFKLVRDIYSGEFSPYSADGVNGVCGAESGQSLTLNLKTKYSDNNEVALGEYMWGSTKLSSGQVVPVSGGMPDEMVVVTNQGDGYSGTVTQGTYVCSEPMTKYQLKNPDYLQDNDYNFESDDLVRFNKFFNTYTSNDLYRPTVDSAWIKRKNPCVNDQYPFIPFYSYPQIAMPTNNGNVSQDDYIIVYDMYTAQDKFNNHGLAVLEPSSCRVVEELNGAFNVTLTHPKDKEGKYQYLLEMNLLKVLGQIFVIQRVEEVISGNSSYINVYAEHVTYTLDDRWIFPPVTIAGYHGQTLIDSIMEQSYDHGGGWQIQYAFTITSDLEAPEDFADWSNMMDGVTPYEMIIGNNGLAARLGGELYRDNFTVSINERMYGALDNAFELKVGYNLTGIKRTVDLTTFCTYLRCFPVIDGEFNGEWWAIAWNPATLPRAYPREVVRSVNFYYTAEEYAEQGLGRVSRDGQIIFNQKCEPQVSYELNIKDLKKNPEYKDFENNYRYKVGDKGKVWDERLKAWVEVEISRTEKNGITGETEKVVIGNIRSFTRPQGYTPVIPSNYSIDVDTILDSTLPLVFNSSGAYLSDWAIYGAEGGVGATVQTEYFDFNSWFTTLMTHVYTYQGVTYTGFYGATVERYTSTGYLGMQVTMTKSTGYSMSYGTYVGVAESAIPIYLPHGKTYTISWVQNKNSPLYVFQVRVYKGNTTTKICEKTSVSQRSMTFTMPDDVDYVCLGFYFSEASDLVMRITNISITADSYEIPVVVTLDAQHTQTIHIPITTPLGANDSISFDDTKIAIPTYSGENTITVDTTVQPSHMSIQYKQPIENEEE